MARILVVEDEPDLQQVLEFNLRQAGHEVLLASRGDAALKVVAAERPDLVLLDLMLPGMRGAEILAVLRSDAHWKRIPCLILTAAGQDEQLREAEALGVSGVMTKPFSPRRLYERVVTLTSAAPSLSRTIPAESTADPEQLSS